MSFEIKTNEHCVLLGRNGAGKSTLVNLIYGMIWATSGKIRLFQEIYGEIPIQDLRKRIGILDSSQQENSLQRKLTVMDVILTGGLPPKKRTWLCRIFNSKLNRAQVA